MKRLWERIPLRIIVGVAWLMGATGLLGVGGGGCAAAVPVAGDVAGTAVDKTSEVFRAGKTESYQAVSKEEVIAAIRRAVEKMHLQPDHEEWHPDQLKLIYHDLRKQIVVVTAVRRTDRATELRVDVGLFGPEGLSQLVMREILHELPGGGELIQEDATRGSGNSKK